MKQKIFVFHFVTLVVVGLLVLGCTALAPAPTPTPTPTPLEILQRSYEQMQGVESYRTQGNYTIQTSSEDFSFFFSTDFEIAVAQEDQARMMLTFEILEEELTFEVITSQEDTYLRLPGEEWTQLSQEEAEELFGQPLSPSDFNFSQSIFPAGEEPWELFTVTPLGREEVDGALTEHLSLEVDFPRLWEMLSDEQKQQLFQSAASGASAEELEELASQMEVKKLEVWVDSQGYRRRFIMELAVSDLGLSVAVEMRLSDFNEEIVIEIPA